MDKIKEKRNLVLIGMPSCGKSTIAKIIAEKTGRERIEMDEVLVSDMGQTIKEAFAAHGEKYFRDHETALCKRLAEKSGCVISCGGGVVVRAENIAYLKTNGLVIWINRALENLHGEASRPLVNSDEKIRQLYAERAHLYEAYSDIEVENNSEPEEAAMQILALLGEE